MLTRMAETLKVIGLMSGTSLDGVDAALLETDGEKVAVALAGLTIPYDRDTRALLRAALDEARKGAPRHDRASSVREAIGQAERRLTDAHANAVKILLRKVGLSPKDVAYIGFHGQTILHRPAERRTWQLGDGAALANATGIAVVNDFRSADVAAGGQGAPLAPLYHAALARDLEKPVAILNIGGVANVTYIGANNELLAFDTGPGNAALDDWAHRHTGEPVDKDGALARRGRVDEKRLAAMLDHAYFAVKPPKSLDRLDFHTEMVEPLAPEDGAATLAAFTAASIARARAHFPAPVKRWIVAGGGRHNPVLMAALRERLNAPVMTAEDAGWRGDFLEAEAFAYLAVRAVKGLPLSVPGTTGVPRPTSGGVLHRPG